MIKYWSPPRPNLDSTVSRSIIQINNSNFDITCRTGTPVQLKISVVGTVFSMIITSMSNSLYMYVWIEITHYTNRQSGLVKRVVKKKTSIGAISLDCTLL